MATECLSAEVSIRGLVEASASAEVSFVAGAEAAADLDSGGRFKLSK
jgi:hypothetical protein